MIFKGSLVRQDKDCQFIFILFHFSLFVLSPRTVQWLDCPLCYKQLNSKTVKWSIRFMLSGVNREFCNLASVTTHKSQYTFIIFHRKTTRFSILMKQYSISSLCNILSIVQGVPKVSISAQRVLFL